MGFVGRGCCKVGEVYRWGVVGTGATPKERRKHAISRLALLAPVKTNKFQTGSEKGVGSGTNLNPIS